MSLSNSGFYAHLTAVVVGASGGIGSALVKQLLSSQRVGKLYGLSRSVPDDIDDARFQAIHIDYMNEGSIKSACDQISGPVDLVIVATGFLHDGSSLQPEKAYTQLTEEKLLANIKVNLIGPTLLAKHLLPKMRSESKSVFAALSARVGSISDNRLGGWYAYRSSKAALNMMIKTLSIEVSRRQKNAIVVGLHPGTVDTGLSKPFQTNVPAKSLFAKDYAAECLLNVIAGLEVSDSGSCIAWDGQKILP